MSNVLREAYFKRGARCAAIINIAASLLVIVGWHAHWQKVLQLLPGTAPMQFNTALGFLISGIALYLLSTSRPKFTPLLGAIVAMLGSLTVLEYLTRLDFHIDLLFFTPFFEAATTYPGRMSPLSATCFIMMGAAIILLGRDGKKPHHFEVAGMLMCVVGLIAVMALVGFICGIVSAYGWGAYSSLALNTSILFLIFSLGVLMFAWQAAQEANSNFVRWLPVTGSVTLMTMVAIVAAGDVARLRAATYWRKHTIEVIFTAQAFDNDLIDLQRAMRNYTAQGDTNALAMFHTMSEMEGSTLTELHTLTSDNPAQEKILNDLDAALAALLRFDERVIALYDEKGAKAAFDLATDSKSRSYFGNTHDTVKKFTGIEQSLLDARDASEETDLRDTERLLISGCVLAAGLLLLANFMATHQLNQRKAAEAKLARQAEALRRSNTELEQFAYVASHDMREPLRAVMSFAQILKTESAGKLEGDSEEMLKRIIDGAKRMANIIDDLLSLSSISSKKRPFESMGLEKPLQLALENLSVAVKERGVTIHCDSLPRVTMDGSQVALLFQNLIGNAIKFCPPDRAPEIHIKAEADRPGVWKISVRDNGIGIEPKYFDKIFGIFQRLHSREEYAGTGIGLAICKKIVERHGGRIWLESAKGSGTTFYFTLDEQQLTNYDDEQPH